MGDPRERILGLAVMLIVLGWPLKTGAGEPCPFGKAEEGLPTPSGSVILLAPRDGKGEQAATPSLRLAVTPLALSMEESPLALRVPAPYRRGHAPDQSDGGLPLAWGRMENPPPPLYFASREGPTHSDMAPGKAPHQEEHWSSFLPLLAEEARRMGYELPLPFGVSGVYTYVSRDIEVTDVRLGVNGAGLASVSQFANFDARSDVQIALVKADAWLLPFFNVYLLLGYVHNTTDINVQITVPRPPPLPGSRQFTLTAKPELDGFVGGGGVTLAGGYREFFIMADVNYTQTDMGFDDRFRALIASARAGWNGKVGKIPLRLWAGGAYWDTKNTAKGTVEVPDVGTVRFEADQGPKNPWNMVVGVSSALQKHFELFAEYGFSPGDLTMFAGGLTLRF